MTCFFLWESLISKQRFFRAMYLVPRPILSHFSHKLSFTAMHEQGNPLRGIKAFYSFFSGNVIFSCIIFIIPTLAKFLCQIVKTTKGKLYQWRHCQSWFNYICHIWLPCYFNCVVLQYIKLLHFLFLAVLRFEHTTKELCRLLSTFSI